MKLYSRLLPLLLASLGGTLSAQEADLAFNMKLRAVAGTQTKEGQLNGFGITFGATKKALGGQLNFEFGYTYLPGTLLRADLSGNSVGVTNANSVISKKHTLDTLGVRAAYGQELNDTWSWHAGVAVNRNKARMETIGDLEGTSGYLGGWTTNREESGVSLQPYAGVAMKMSDSGSLELNLAAYNYKLADVTPAYKAGSVSPAWGNKSISDVKLEFAYVFHF